MEQKIPSNIVDIPWIYESKESYEDYEGNESRELLAKKRVDEWKIKLEQLSLSEFNEFNEFVEKYPSISTSDTGKWMLFYKKGAYFDEKWNQLKTLYNEGELKGITSMKCSTNYPNPRSNNASDGVIILYCNYSFDEDYILRIGKNVKEKIYYDRHMYYKTDSQTFKGTRATGQKKNYIYKLHHCYV